MPDVISSIEQKRAKFAYDCAYKGVIALKKNKKEKEQDKKQKICGGIYEDDNYDSYVKKIPMLIKTNSLGAALAFVFSKRQKDHGKPKNAYDLIYKQLKQWLMQLVQYDMSVVKLEERDELIEKVVSLNSAEYRAVTIEVLAFLTWLRRFTEGMSKDEDTTMSAAE